MLERFILDALTQQIDELKAKPTRVSRIFGTMLGLADPEVAGIRTFFEASPPSVILQYPREDSTFPLYAIVLRDENESTKFLDDLSEELTAEDAAELGFQGEDLTGAPVAGAMFSHEINILTYAKHRDVCVYYYHLAKYFMFRARKFFNARGMSGHVLGGGDLAPDQRYLPAYLFARTLRYRFETEIRVVGDVPARGIAVTGIHIVGGSPSGTAGMGGVIPGVTPKP